VALAIATVVEVRMMVDEGNKGMAAARSSNVVDGNLRRYKNSRHFTFSLSSRGIFTIYFTVHSANLND
jgi:hypothetical protein